MLLLHASVAWLALIAARAQPALAGLTTQPRAAGWNWQVPHADAAASGGPLLTVPFVAQEPLLCGAAAVEMTLRYAGVRGVLARDFVGLVRPEEGGIRTGELAQAVRARGWAVRAGPMDPATLHAHLVAGRPVTVLLAESGDRYHYVLVVGWTAGAVVVHDPGRAPGLRLPATDFLSRWQAAGGWAMVLLSRTSPDPREDPGRLSATPGASERSGAGAAVAAPANVAARGAALSPHPLLVKASALFRASRWRDAADAAWAASRADPSDSRVWTVLASSRYLAGDPQGALEAWSHAEPPRVDRVSVRGLRRTRHPVAHALLGIRPGEPLLPADMARARRRLALLPSAGATSVAYRALPGGLADVEATALEGSLLPRSPARWAGLLLPAVAASELDLTVASALQAGEAVTLSVRWSAARPAAGVRLAVPGFPPTGGVARLGAGWERERYRDEAHDRVLEETRARAHLVLTDWASGWLRWEVGGGVERWRRAARWGPASAVLRAAIELSPISGRGDLLATVEGAAGGADGRSYMRWAVRGTADLLPDASKWGLRARAFAAGASGSAPRMVWPGAGTEHAREGLLRAHGLERDGALGGPGFGRRLLNASLELERVLITLPVAELGAATFADVGRVTRPGEAAAPAHSHLLDVGAGLWLALPGGRLQLNAAAGTDGSKALSLTWRRVP